MPAYNEEGNIEQAVRGACSAAAPLVADYEVVVVDDGSRDGTPAILARLQQELAPRLHVVRHAANLGYGAALRDGFEAARGEIVFYTDSDNQFDLRELEDALPFMRDYDALFGFRVDRQDPLLRKLSSAAFNTLASLAFGMSVRDLNCSFKLFRRERIRSLALESDDFFVDTELVARIHRAGWRYVQRGVRHYPRREGHSTVRARDVPRTLASLIRMWFRLRRPDERTPRETPSA
jgi:glycosyltransferase involved in cell wall biosynthesis